MQITSLGGATVLITGGTGSFGHAAVSKLLESGVSEIRIFSRDEKKQDDMRKNFRDHRLKYIIGDVRDRCSISEAMPGVDYVFNAAALKQVPSCEFYPNQAVLTNIIGTENTINAAISNSVRSVVVLSTDKAVYPINAMGMSKGLMEKVAIAKSRCNQSCGTKISITRYGNVMASRGSVIPLFVEQILRNVPITITNPSMTRFMMDLDQAVSLVLHAFESGISGDTFIQKSPAATIVQLAHVLQKILDKKCEIKEIGIRHGEKMHETLMSREERFRSNESEKYFCIPADSRDLSYGEYYDIGQSYSDELNDYTSSNTHLLTDGELEAMLLKLPLIASSLGQSTRKE
jgi:UDP-N-acetylglucosamine 4,6-dehydratase